MTAPPSDTLSPADLTFISGVIARARTALNDPQDFTPLHAPEFSGREWEMVKDCLDTGWVSSVGKYVDAFESRVAEISGTKYGVAVVNGTAALEISLIVAGVKPGDEVLMPSLTFVATPNAAHHAGAVPHFVDSCPNTLGLDPVALRDHLTTIAERRPQGAVNRETGRRLAALVPMHTFGFPVDMDALTAVASDWGIPVVEDAAESLGSSYKDRPCGGLGLVGAVSFNGNKILTTGGGGAIVTNDEALAKRAKHLTTTAKIPHRWAFEHDEIGYNYRMPNLNAALGVAQLEQLDDRLARKRALAQRYFDAFSGFNGGMMQAEPKGTRSNYWLNTFVLGPDRQDQRDALLDALNADGLMARPIWTLMHRLKIYADCPRAPLPVAMDLERRIINLPSSAELGV